MPGFLIGYGGGGGGGGGGGTCFIRMGVERGIEIMGYDDHYFSC